MTKKTFFRSTLNEISTLKSKYIQKLADKKGVPYTKQIIKLDYRDLEVYSRKYLDIINATITFCRNRN